MSETPCPFNCGEQAIPRSQVNMLAQLFKEIDLSISCTVGSGRNSMMVSMSVREAGRAGSSPSRSVCISHKERDLPVCYQLVPSSADDWFNKDGPCVIMSM